MSQFSEIFGFCMKVLVGIASCHGSSSSYSYALLSWLALHPVMVHLPPTLMLLSHGWHCILSWFIILLLLCSSLMVGIASSHGSSSSYSYALISWLALHPVMVHLPPTLMLFSHGWHCILSWLIFLLLLCSYLMVGIASCHGSSSSYSYALISWLALHPVMVHLPPALMLLSHGWHCILSWFIFLLLLCSSLMVGIAFCHGSSSSYSYALISWLALHPVMVHLPPTLMLFSLGWHCILSWLLLLLCSSLMVGIASCHGSSSSYSYALLSWLALHPLMVHLPPALMLLSHGWHCILSWFIFLLLLCSSLMVGIASCHGSSSSYSYALLSWLALHPVMVHLPPTLMLFSHGWHCILSWFIFLLLLCSYLMVGIASCHGSSSSYSYALLSWLALHPVMVHLPPTLMLFSHGWHCILSWFIFLLLLCSYLMVGIASSHGSSSSCSYALISLLHLPNLHTHYYFCMMGVGQNPHI